MSIINNIIIFAYINSENICIMGYFTEQLKKYLANATPEQLEKDYKELEEFNKIGPSFEEFFLELEEIPNMLIKGLTIDSSDFNLGYLF